MRLAGDDRLLTKIRAELAYAYKGGVCFHKLKYTPVADILLLIDTHKEISAEIKAEIERNKNR